MKPSVNQEIATFVLIVLVFMGGSIFGKVFQISTYGESHGRGIGVVIDGCPSGVVIDEDLIAEDLLRRKPGQSKITTARNETESFQIYSGVFDGKSTGAPIAILVANTDQKSKDYNHLKDGFRPSHADFTYFKKYGIRDHAGGGRSSARETVARVIAGSIAKMILEKIDVSIAAYVDQVGDVRIPEGHEVDLALKESNIVRCPDEETAKRMIALIEAVKTEGDTVGGSISCVVRGCPAGLGEPVFDKLHADLAEAIMSINAVKGFELGSGFDCINMRGSEHNDQFIKQEGNRVLTKTNFSGGIQGGISNGMPIVFRAAFKPVSTIMRVQESVNKAGDKIHLEGKGRHDPCVVPRAVPIVEAMAALVIVDHFLRDKTIKMDSLLS